MMEGKDSVCGLPAETSPEIEKSITMIEAQNKSVDPGQQFQRKQVQSMYEEVAEVMEDIMGPVAGSANYEHTDGLTNEGEMKDSRSEPSGPAQNTRAFSIPGSSSPVRSKPNGLGCVDDDSATESVATSSDSEVKNHGAAHAPYTSAITDSKSVQSTRMGRGEEAQELECPESNSAALSDEKHFLQDLADKFLESKKLGKKECWTMKDVLASGHLSGLEVEFRTRIGDPQGSGSFGRILDDGKIRCYCKACIQNPPPMGFTGTRWEEHFGGKSQRPFLHIFFKHIDLSLKEFWNQWCEKNGSSSTKTKSSKSKRVAPATPYTRRIEGARCSECNGGASQLVCEGCDSLFHLRCIGMLRMPIGNWFCQECVLSGRDTLYSEVSLRNRSEKRRLLMNSSDNGTSASKRHKPHQSEVSAEGQQLSWPSEDIQKLMKVAEGCTYVLRDLDYVSGSCALCGSPDYEEVISKDLDPRTIIICDTCECEYHIGCLKSKKMADLKEIPEDDWFCSPKCRRVNSVLLSAVKNGEVWPDKKLSYCILRGRLTTSDNMRRVKKVEQIVTSCFDPVVDGITKENLLPMIVRGQRLSNSWDFSGFHSLLLKVNRVWVAAALFKVYKDTAEVPFVATDPEYRGRGYSRKIMQVLEKVVRKAGIEKMLLPSAEATVDLWTKPQFGFKRASEDYTQGNRFLQFPGTVWLEKLM